MCIIPNNDIFRTNPLPNIVTDATTGVSKTDGYRYFTMLVVSLSFGVGTLAVAAILKALPERFTDKIPELLNESASNQGNDMLSKITSKKKDTRSETQRLLDSD